MWNIIINHPTWAYPLRDFRKICRICTLFQNVLDVNVLSDLLKGLWNYGGFKLTVVWLLPNFQWPLAAKLCVRPQKDLEVQERAQGRLSPIHHSKFGLALMSPAAGAAKNVEFFLCLSVFPSRFGASEFARFRHEGVGVQKRF